MFFSDFSIFALVAWTAGFLAALTVHEAAHAAVANWLGDPTARLAGRLTLNPFAHLDPMGTVCLLLIGLGWGKPVPVNPENFRSVRGGEILVSVAGPLANIILAFILAIPLHLLLAGGGGIAQVFTTIIQLNLALAVFNLLPLPPLDGGGMVAALLSGYTRLAFLRTGPLVLLGLFAVDFVFSTGIIWGLLKPVINLLFVLISVATGFGVV